MVTTKRAATHKWLFPSRIRPNTFTWKSSSRAATRIKEAVAEIKSVSRNDPTAAAEGAVRLIERFSSALEHVDSSSGALRQRLSEIVHAIGVLRRLRYRDIGRYRVVALCLFLRRYRSELPGYHSYRRRAPACRKIGLTFLEVTSLS